MCDLRVLNKEKQIKFEVRDVKLTLFFVTNFHVIECECL